MMDSKMLKEVFDFYIKELRSTLEDYCSINNINPWEVDINPIYNQDTNQLSINLKYNGGDTL